MEFKDIVMQRYATKKFDGRKVPEAKMKELLELIRFAPSALNVQPWKIKVVTDPKVKEQLEACDVGTRSKSPPAPISLSSARTPTSKGSSGGWNGCSSRRRCPKMSRRG